MGSRRALVYVLVGALAVGIAAFFVGRIAFAGDQTATPQEYQVTVRKIRNRVDYSLEQMARSTSLEELTQRLGEAAEAVDAAADDLSDAPVAPEVEEQHKQLVKALNGLSGELAGAAATLGDPTFEDTIPFLRSLGFPTWDQANEALEGMRKRGIDVELLQRYSGATADGA